MPRELSMVTKRDMELLALNKEVRKIIKTKKEWLAFVRYMKVYYK